MSLQLNLNFTENSQNSQSFLELFKDIILLENPSSFKLLEKFFSQKKFSENSINNLILICDKDFEKEFLIKFFSAKIVANSFDFNQIQQFFFERKSNPVEFIIIEKINKIEDQERLFHIINYCLNEKIFLLLTTEEKKTFKLKDLNSRFKNIASARIEKPKNIELILSVIFAEKQIMLSRQIINFFAKNITRNYQTIFSLADFIEQKINQNSKINLVKERSAKNLSWANISLQEFISSVNCYNSKS